MFKMARKTVIAAIASASMLAGMIPAQAMPIVQTNANGVRDGGNIQLVDGRGYGGPRGYGRGYDGPRHGYDRGGPRRGHYYDGRRAYRPPPPPPRYYRGNSWNNNNNAWVPLGIGAGALIIGGAIAATNNNNNRTTNAGINPQHYQWCFDKYRSYRSADNTFQPYNGPRQQCYSPYY